MPDRMIRDQDVAVIAMAGRFPGAPSVAQFWQNLCDGVESIHDVTDEDLAAAGYHAYQAGHPDYVRRRPVLDDIRGFDATFFGYSPREASIADPQQRIFLECCHETLELAGYGIPGARDRVGLFAGSNLSSYMYDRFGDPDVALHIDPYEMVIGNDKDALTTVVAYRLDLTGPAVTVQSFCSTSAVAIHLACQSLRHGECDMALAGGVCVRVPDRVGYVYVQGGMLAPDGVIRTFDAKAQGSVFGDGSGVVLLKPLRRALEDRDTVLAVIRGSAMNNDGFAKFSYTAPSVAGQSTAIEAALADAEVSPRDISYVEAHGTATALGDPIEVSALTRAFRSAEKAYSGSDLRDRQYCAIGSVKTNVGHLDRAATVTGMIKVVEALRHGLIPRSLNFETPNAEIDFPHSPFYVAADPVPWPKQSGHPRLAGLNGLGMGGTNVHVVLEEAPDAPVRRPSPRRWHLLPVSGRTEQAANDYCEHLAAHLGEADAAGQSLDLADASFTLEVGRAPMAHRRAVIADSAGAAAAAFAGRPGQDSVLLARHDPVKGRRSIFMFAGVGEHYTGMMSDLYAHEPTFRRHLNEGQELLSTFAPIDVLTPLTTRSPDAARPDLAVLMGRQAPSDRGPLSNTAVAQPAVFLAELALARTLIDWGVIPDLVLGFSVGEYVAACLAGVLSAPDAVRMVAHRAALIAELPQGSMLAVGRSWEALQALVPDLADRGVELSADVPGQVVIGGSVDAIADVASELRARGAVCRELDTSHAFHTGLLRPVAEDLTAWVAANITLGAPTLGLVSNVTGELADAALVTDPAYWAEHMCRPVQFSTSLATALARSSHLFVEIGPGKSLGAMVRSHPECDRSRWPLVVSTAPGALDTMAGDRALVGALAELQLAGVDVDWTAYHRLDLDRVPGRVPMPTYPFQRQPYWFVTPSEADGGGSATSTASGPEDLLSEYETLPLLPESSWLNLGVWKERAPRPALSDPGERWVIFTDDGDADAVARAVGAALAGAEHSVTLVRPGADFARDEKGFRVRPGSIEDILELFVRLKQQGGTPDRVVHLWTLAEASARDTVELGLNTLIAIARAAREVGFDTWALDVVTSGTLQVGDDDPIVPARATVHGPCTILPVEDPGGTIRLVDLVHGRPAPVDHVVRELLTAPANQVLALRGGRRWMPDFEILELADELDPQAVPLRDNGVYLVTGGLGGIGLALAERLARDAHARLVLMGRTPTPARERWGAILADPTTRAEVRRRIEGLQLLDSLGCEFEVVAGNVAEPADVVRAVQRARERFGALHGIIHAAGVPGMGMMQFKTIDDVERVLAPKVWGTLAIAEAIGDDPLDFLVLFSSVAAWTGALGQADYSAANAFLDAFARSGALRQTKVVSIGWGEWTWNGWEEGLAGYEPVLRAFYIHHREVFGIDFDAGWRCLKRILTLDVPHLVVNTQDFSTSLAGSRNYTIRDIQAGARKGRGDQRYPRPELSTPYISPATPQEEAVAEIWGEWLGIDQVGVQDNFFDLGGNSLIGVGVTDAVRAALELDHLPAHLLYQAPTVSALTAAALASRAADPGEVGEAPVEEPIVREPDDERAQLRQKRLAQRRTSVRGEAR
ncbi:MAG: SDR family NAD(P)-dependent oxidoreductase [Kineosporiaceae bacterium]|nr:SDR family NAD(P)-dependent oxidoreductase [Kineosporiaceae bacterium]